MYSFKATWLACAAAILLGVSGVDASLTHRYSFEADASDSVGGADGTLMNGASIVMGQVVLDGQAISQSESAQYVDLPSEMIAINTYAAASFEAWYTADTEAGNHWARIFDFGNSVDGFGGDLIALTTRNNTGNMSLLISNTQPGYYGQEYVNGPVQPKGETHAVVVVKEGPGDSSLLELYVDGVLEESGQVTNSLSEVSNNLAFLGKSMYPSDMVLQGSINEFRIWDNALTADEIVANYVEGPNAVIPEPGTAALSGPRMVDLVGPDMIVHVGLALIALVGRGLINLFGLGLVALVGLGLFALIRMLKR